MEGGREVGNMPYHVKICTSYTSGVDAIKYLMHLYKLHQYSGEYVELGMIHKMATA